MGQMMRWSCSRGCCVRDNRAAEKREWQREQRREAIAPEPYDPLNWVCPIINRRCPDECGNSGSYC